MNLIEIFRAGTRQDANGNTVTITTTDLQTIANNYSTEYHEAPIVVGHPKHDNPAYGWVKGLSVEGDVLKAELQQVDSEFAELVRDGKFKKISAAFYLPNTANNPKPEGFYLRHVGFLGAMPPAVKGLKDPLFADNDTDFIEFNEPVMTTAKSEGGTMSEADKQRLAELEAENAKLKAAQAQAQREKMQAENATFTESLVKDGKLSPKQRDAALALLNTEHRSAEFAEDEFKSRLKQFLSELPKSVEFAEVATKDKVAEPQDDTIEYAEGTDPASIEMDKKIRAHMKAHNVTYVQAFNAINQ